MNDDDDETLTKMVHYGFTIDKLFLFTKCLPRKKKMMDLINKINVTHAINTKTKIISTFLFFRTKNFDDIIRFSLIFFFG